MKQIFLEKGKIKKLDIPTPPLRPNHILVKVRYSFISTGTEGATLKESKKSLLQKCLSQTTEKISKIKSAVKDNGIGGTIALIKGSLNKVLEIGYSCSGQVVAVGEGVDKVKIGDLVACAGSSIANHAEYVSVPKNLAIKIKDEKFLKQASLTTIGAIALQGVRRANLALGEKVCVIGLGLIGQITAQLAKQAGCTVYGVDIDDSKLFLAQKLGCEYVYNSYDIDITKEILFNSEHYGVDTTIITAASQSGKIIQQAMEVTRRKGKVVLVGDVKIDFDRNPFYQKEIDFLISCSYGPGRYDKSYEQRGIDYPYGYVRWTENRNMGLFAQLLEESKIDVEPLISHEFDFDKAGEAYEKLFEDGALGLVLRYEGDSGIGPSIHPPITLSAMRSIVYRRARTYKAPKVQALARGQVNVGFIGAGGFAKVKLLPLASKIKSINIHTIVDTNPTNAVNLARQYGAVTYDNDYKKVLDDKRVHAVVIATPHALHAQQAIDALSAGKAVFVEKPAAVTKLQYDKLKDFLNKNKNCLYCVDFNRSFAPFTLKIKSVIKNRTTPLVIHYRMNAGFIPKDHWIQSANHGGRIIGEACHIFELFSFLTDSKPVNISVNSINTTRDDLLSSDNFSVQISFSDGSICSLLYTAIGHAGLAKERMEVFFDGKSIVMDDYRVLKGYGLGRSFNCETKRPDKGHNNLLTQFFDTANTGGPSPLGVDRILMATEVALEVNRLIL